MAEPYILPFTNKTESVIPYPDSMEALYGDYPKVEVLYWDDDADEFYLANNFVRLSFTYSVKTGKKVIIDHGGAATGIIKLS